MGISLYVMQGIFLLLAARDPSANRGVITFAAWLNIAHAAVMTVMSIHLPHEHQDLLVASGNQASSCHGKPAGIRCDR